MKKTVLLVNMILMIFILSSCSFIGNNKDKDNNGLGKNDTTEVFNNNEVEPLFPAYAMKDNVKKWGFINKTGEFIIEPLYDKVFEFTIGGTAVTFNSIPDTYFYFDGGTSYYNNEGTVAVIDYTGNVIAGPFENVEFNYFKDNMFVIKPEYGGSLVYTDMGEKLFETENNITGYGNGMFVFSKNQGYDSLVYGYMDTKGDIVIPARYSYADAFEGDLALVRLTSDKYAIINRGGVIVESSDYYIEVSQYIGELKQFRSNDTYKWGYKDETGKVIIEALYTTTKPFVDGFAPVQCEIDEYDYRWGVIDNKGQFVIQPDYSGISYIGNGLFEVGEFHEYYNEYNLPSAIFDSSGNQISSFKYFNVQDFKGDYASVCDGVNTLFIDKSGHPDLNLPVVKGSGIIKFNKGIIVAEIDDNIAYYSTNNELIWEGDDTLTFENDIRVRKEKYQPNYYISIFYPQLEGNISKEVRDIINKDLKEAFIGEYDNNEIEPTQLENGFTYSVNYKVNCNKNLLTIDLNGYYYPWGAAYGYPYSKVFNIDIRTGRHYKLEDLFIKDSKYLERLTSIVQKMVDLNGRIGEYYFYYYEDLMVDVNDSVQFKITSESIVLNYDTYEIAPYVSGPQSFEILFEDISDIIDTKGELWDSFERKNITRKPMNLSSINKNIINLIENVLEQYENQLIEAINTNSFEKVSPVLKEGSELYISQKNLITDLYNKGIKEKLINYEVYAVTRADQDNFFNIYVLENIEITYPNKSPEVKEFTWCYKAEYDNESNSVKLTDIQKW